MSHNQTNSRAQSYSKESPQCIAIPMRSRSYGHAMSSSRRHPPAPLPTSPIPSIPPFKTPTPQAPRYTRIHKPSILRSPHTLIPNLSITITTTATMFRTQIARQARLFSTSPIARKSPVETVKDAAKAVDQTISGAAVKGIEKGGMYTLFCTSSDSLFA